MGYIGNTPAERYSTVSYQDLTGGTGTSFTLDHAVGSANEIEVFVNNVRQEPSVAYTVAGTALTMTGSIASTDDFYVVFQGKAQQTVTHPATHALEATDGTFTGNVDINGNELILDADADTKLYASTDDVVKMNIAGSEVFRFDSDGLKFNGDTASANALDDYEEGSWTPVITFGGNSAGQTYRDQNGRYIKIGNAVIVSCYVSFINKGTSTGAALLTGLPFASRNQSAYYHTPQGWYNSMTLGSDYNFHPYHDPNTTNIVLWARRGQDYSGVQLNNSNFGNATDMMITYTYIAE